jgi:adenylate cyclase
MAEKVLLLQADPRGAQPLVDFFTRRGDRVFLTAKVEEAHSLAIEETPGLVFIDLHLPGNGLLNALQFVQAELPKAGIVITNKTPDVRRELLAKQRGAHVFLRQPFTPRWIEQALVRLQRADLAGAAPVATMGALPPVRMPMRAKIALPYAILALVFALGAAFLVSRFVLESIRDRFVGQLIDTRKIAADWMVREEDRLLGTLRTLANTQGISARLSAEDAEGLRAIVLPVVVNANEDIIEYVNLSGASVLSMRLVEGQAGSYQVTRGAGDLVRYEFIQAVLRQVVDQQGDKFSGLVVRPEGAYFYVAGPVYDEQGQLAGAAAVGERLITLARKLRAETLAHATLYDFGGQVLATTLGSAVDLPHVDAGLAGEVLQRQGGETPVRELKVSSGSYSEALGIWETRQGVDLGLLGAALAENFLAQPTVITQVQILGFVIFVFLGVIGLGLYISSQITRPLGQMVKATVEVARGNLEVKVNPRGDDEIMLLAYAFNYMVLGLQEGSIYRDLLGRTVSPEVREAMRRSFATGNLRLEGQNTVATVLMSDIRNFTALSEKEEPTTILNWLNEYFSELVPIIASHGGVIDKFEGDSMLAFFGILPTPLPPEESGYQACKAALELLAIIERINERRAGRGEPPLITGIGVNTGSLTAGGLGTADRLNYTIIGDTVNTTQRIQGLTREFGESGIVISENTLAALARRRNEFRFEPLGEHAFRGKMEMLWLYRLHRAGQAEGVRAAR